MLANGWRCTRSKTSRSFYFCIATLCREAQLSWATVGRHVKLQQGGLAYYGNGVLMPKAPEFIRGLVRPVRQWLATKRGYDYNYPKMNEVGTAPSAAPDEPSNRLREFFRNRNEGPGIWKWDHYFDIYDRHLKHFRGQEVHVLEIGVYSGGGLDMWRDYFGPRVHLYGVDIEEACRVYERDGTKIFIGDQGDRSFWRDFRRQVPVLDVVLDDGCHYPDLQTLTLEELLPHLRRGGVYLCEDVHGGFNRFASYVQGLAHKLNQYDLAGLCTPFQSDIDSVHFYPFLAAIEKTAVPVEKYTLEKRGTEWQHFWWETSNT
jgi:hypothetical protein